MGRAFEVRKAAMAKTAHAKTKVYSRYGREIFVAARSGEPDPELNQELRRIIDRAKKDQVPGDIIKRAIDRARGGADETYTQVRYEGFGVGGSQVIVECLTDNVNRTISEVRNCFTKTDGKLGVSGSVVHQFVRQTIFELKNIDEEQAMEIAFEANLELFDLEVSGDSITLYGDVNDYHNIKKAYQVNPLIVITEEEIAWLPLIEHTIISEDDRKMFDKLLEMLDVVEDVQDVFYNVV